MRVFLTGATGFIGSRIVPELLAAGHHVVGLTRSETGAQSLQAAGAEVHYGNLEDLDSLYQGATSADAVIHTAFDHDFSNFVANCEKDRRVIETLGSALKGSNRPLIITSGTGIGSRGPGQLAMENVFDTGHANPRIASELAGNALIEIGVDVRVVRLPQVHDRVRQGLISPYIAVAREKGAAAYIGEGTNRWPAAHVLDVAKLYALVLDKGQKGARYHAVAEEGIAVREIAQVVGTGLGVPVVSVLADDAPSHFGWLALFVGQDLAASSQWTRQQLAWQPGGAELTADLRMMAY